MLVVAAVVAVFGALSAVAIASSPHFKKGGEPVCTITGTGQNRVLVGPSTTPTHIPSSAVKNGNVTFTTNPAVLSAPSTVSGAEAGCPNQNWTGVNTQLTVTS